MVDAQNPGTEAFQDFYRLHRERVYWYFRTRTGSPEDADDLTQQTFAKAWAALSKPDAQCDATAVWLFTIARHLVVDRHRQARRRGWLTTPLPDIASSDDTESEVEYADEYRQVRSIVSDLPKDKQDLIALRFAAGLTIPDIARLIKRTPEATRKQLSRTLQQIERRINETC